MQTSGVMPEVAFGLVLPLGFRQHKFDTPVLCPSVGIVLALDFIGCDRFAFAMPFRFQPCRLTRNLVTASARLFDSLSL